MKTAKANNAQLTGNVEFDDRLLRRLPHLRKLPHLRAGTTMPTDEEIMATFKKHTNIFGEFWDLVQDVDCNTFKAMVHELLKDR